MSTEAVERRSAGRRLADLFHGRPRLQAGALLSGPVAWLVIGYLGSLAVLLVSGFWTVNALSGELVQGFSLGNFQTLLEETRTDQALTQLAEAKVNAKGKQKAA